MSAPLAGPDLLAPTRRGRYVAQGRDAAHLALVALSRPGDTRQSIKTRNRGCGGLLDG